MSGKGIYFFATRSDAEKVIQEIESGTSLTYTRTGLFETQPQTYASVLSIPDFGTCRNGHRALEPFYLVLPSTCSLEVRTVQQNDGGRRYAIDQQVNPSSIVFQPSGIYSSTAVIMGSITTISQHADSLALYKLFTQKLRKGFQKAGSAYVGPEALRLAKEGYRLTDNINRPVEHDFKI